MGKETRDDHIGEPNEMVQTQTSIRAQAEANVTAIRGSWDVPGFEACVNAEMERLKPASHSGIETALAAASQRDLPIP